MNLREYFENVCGSSQTAFENNVNDKLNELIAASPDFVYPNKCMEGCEYNSGPESQPDKTTGCLFGQVFQGLGITLEDSDEGSVESVLNQHDIQCLQKWAVYQMLQDAGCFWGMLKSTYIHLSKRLERKIRVNS